MSVIEVLVVVLCLVAGYWIVLKLMSRSPQQRPRAQQGLSGGAVDGVPPWSLPEDPNGVAWNGVLGVDANATVEEIRRAYAEQSAQYHPGKVVELGAEIQAVAERKSNEIATAYRRGMRERGVGEQLW